jgi:hypothetical protein
MPPGTRLGANAFAFIGGFRLWEPGAVGPPSPSSTGNGRAQPVAGDWKAMQPAHGATRMPEQMEKPQ